MEANSLLSEDIKPTIKEELLLPTADEDLQSIPICFNANVTASEKIPDSIDKVGVERNKESFLQNLKTVKKELCIQKTLLPSLTESDIEKPVISPKFMSVKKEFSQVLDVEKIKHESIDISEVENPDIDEELEHEDVQKILSEGNGVFYSCNTCREELDTLKSFNIHGQTHQNIQPTYTKFFTCALCAYACKKPLSINAHRAKTHVGRKAFKCDLCEYSTKRSSVLKNHKLTHSLFRCDLCDFSSKRPSSITIHKQTHLAGQSFKCSSCDFTCLHLTALKLHASIHSNIETEQISCELCDYKCKKLSALKKHKATQHQNDCQLKLRPAKRTKVHQNDRPYKCEVCSKTFKFDSVLKTHLLKHSSDKVTKRNTCEFTTSKN